MVMSMMMGPVEPDGDEGQSAAGPSAGYRNGGDGGKGRDAAGERSLNALGHAKHRKVSGKNAKQHKPPFNQEHKP